MIVFLAENMYTAATGAAYHAVMEQLIHYCRVMNKEGYEEDEGFSIPPIFRVDAAFLSMISEANPCQCGEDDCLSSRTFKEFMSELDKMFGKHIFVTTYFGLPEQVRDGLVRMLQWMDVGYCKEDASFLAENIFT